jgi:hypothetical protein
MFSNAKEAGSTLSQLSTVLLLDHIKIPPFQKNPSTGIIGGRTNVVADKDLSKSLLLHMFRLKSTGVIGRL